MMIGDYYFFLLIIAHFLSRLCTGWLAELAELAESPRIRTSSRFPKIGRQAGRQAATFGRDRTGERYNSSHHASIRIIHAFLFYFILFYFAPLRTGAETLAMALFCLPTSYLLRLECSV